MNGEHIATQYQEQIGEDLFVSLIDEENQLDILVENMSRVNYGHRLLAETQRKGIRQGVMSDLHLQSLYIPKGFLQKENEVIIFETEGKFAETLRFTKTPQYDLVETSLYER